MPFDFEKAGEEKERVQVELNQQSPSHRAVLYRMTRCFDRLYIWRQRPGSDGNQHHPDEPAENLKEVGYFIVTTPEDLVHDLEPEDDAALSDAVRAICIDFSQKGAPDPAGPHVVAPPIK
jgi:hypothetical protein